MSKITNLVYNEIQVSLELEFGNTNSQKRCIPPGIMISSGFYCPCLVIVIFENKKLQNGTT